jgi:hypothetical protein
MTGTPDFDGERGTYEAQRAREEEANARSRKARHAMFAERRGFEFFDWHGGIVRSLIGACEETLETEEAHAAQCQEDYLAQMREDSEPIEITFYLRTAKRDWAAFYQAGKFERDGVRPNGCHRARFNN